MVGRLIEALFAIEKQQQQMIGYYNRTVGTKNKNQGAKINLAMAVLIIIKFSVLVILGGYL